MTNLEYLLVTSIMPVGALIMAAVLLYATRDGPDRLHPGE